MDGWGLMAFWARKYRLYHAWGSLKFVSKANGVYKRDYTFRTNVMEQIFEIRSCIEILANDIMQD